MFYMFCENVDEYQPNLLKEAEPIVIFLCLMWQTDTALWHSFISKCKNIIIIIIIIIHLQCLNKNFLLFTSNTQQVIIGCSFFILFCFIFWREDHSCGNSNAVVLVQRKIFETLVLPVASFLSELKLGSFFDRFVQRWEQTAG